MEKDNPAFFVNNRTNVIYKNGTIHIYTYNFITPTYHIIQTCNNLTATHTTRNSPCRETNVVEKMRLTMGDLNEGDAGGEQQRNSSSLSHRKYM